MLLRRATVALALLSPFSALAGGMEVGDTGAEAMGRGGAFVAKADDPSAINYNPAGFVKLRGHHVTLGGNLVYSAHAFTRAGYFSPGSSSEALPYPAVESQTPVFVAPRHLMMTTDFGVLDRWTFAAGLYVPSAVGGEYPREIDTDGATVGAPQRYTMVQAGGLIFFPSLAVAVRPASWLDIGVSFQWVVSVIKTTNVATAGSACDQPEDPGCDIVIDIEAKDLFSPTGSAGVLLRPLRNLEMGAMVRLPSFSRLQGKANVTLGPALKRLEGSLTKPMMDPLDPDITLSNDYPWMARAGLRYVLRDGDEEVGDLEADIIFEKWSDVSERKVEIQGQSLGKAIAPTIMNYHYNDTVGFRLGGSYRLRLAPSLDLVLRAGAFFESATTDVSDTSLCVLGARRLGVTGGLGLRWGRYRLDAAYAHLFFPDRVVNQSTVRAQDFGGETGPVVGNGTYEASVDMLFMQLTVAFGRGVEQPRGRVPTLPHDPHFDERRHGPWVTPAVPTFDPEAEPPPSADVKNYDGGAGHVAAVEPAPTVRPFKSDRGAMRHRGPSARRSARTPRGPDGEAAGFEFEPATVSRTR